MPDNPCLSLAVDRLADVEPRHYAIWVLQAPSPSGYVHHNRQWTDTLTATWNAWQNFFPIRGVPNVPLISSAFMPPALPDIEPNGDTTSPATGQPTSYTVRIMQQLGVDLWRWLFDGRILSSFDQASGIAMGQGKPLRLRLEIRDPDLIMLPWEIMQAQPGRPAISLNNQQVLFSRTTSEVDSLPPQRTEQFLRVLLVLGHNPEAQFQQIGAPGGSGQRLALEQEAESLSQLLKSAGEIDPYGNAITPVACQVDTLIEPTKADLIQHLETGAYNVLFYSGHGAPAPDGGLLFLRSDAEINGTELAQVLVRVQVKLAVFNACWGAQPDHREGTAIPRSSLAEVLIHHGVPAVLGMRDSITDEEALSFIRVFAQQLARRSPIDEAVAIARQNLLALYRFNQAAWTLPVLYMHPEFNGELIRPYTEGVTEIPDQSVGWLGRHMPQAYLRSLAAPPQIWSLRGGIMRVGRGEGNDVVLQQPEVSREHAEILYQSSAVLENGEPVYLLRDKSRCGTWVSVPASPSGWMLVQNQEVRLPSKTQLRFGNPRGQALEFVIGSPPL